MFDDSADVFRAHAFLWEEGRATSACDLGTLPGYAFSSATSVNNIGMVVGYVLQNEESVAEPFVEILGASAFAGCLRYSDGHQ